MKFAELLLKSAPIPVAIGLGLGASACGGQTTSSPNQRSAEHSTLPACNNYNGLTRVRNLGQSQLDGSTDAINVGDCAPIYDPTTQKTIAVLGRNAAFSIICFDPDQRALQIETSSNIPVTGDVRISQDTTNINYPTVPICVVPQPVNWA